VRAGALLRLRWWVRRGPADNYKSFEDVTRALREAGLESSNLIVGA
jgi:hypothetical protein